jgi:hypothetical protein
LRTDRGDAHERRGDAESDQSMISHAPASDGPLLPRARHDVVENWSS